MILHALVDYYDRKRDSDASAVAPPGWEYREIAFFLDVADDGSSSLVDRRTPEWKRGAPLLVPAAEIRSGNDAWKKPNLLWDHIGFTLGQQKRKPDGTLDPTDKPEKVAKQHAAFKDRVRALAEKHSASPGLRAIMTFYDAGRICPLLPSAEYGDLLSGAGLSLTFRCAGSVEPVCHEQWVSAECSLSKAPLEADVESAEGQCLISGNRGAVARLHPKVSGVTQKPAPLVAANTNEAPAYSSYGLQQAFNAPVSPEFAAKYVGALNRLLARNARSRIQIADTTTIIWADRETDADAEFAELFGGDDPDAKVASVRKRLDGVRSGAIGADDSRMHFFVLGLAPNASRIAVRFWLREPFERLAPRVLQHFDDLRIARAEHEPATPSMFRLLTAIAPQGKADNIPPRLAGEWMRAVFEGTPYPPALLNAAVNRCRAEQATSERAGNVTHLRAAILKACINRAHRRIRGLPPDFQFIPEDLDLNQTDPAYRLGRLFAVLERIQARAQPGINATIRDRYYGAASSTPGAVFPTLLRLKNSHLKKLADSETAYFERLIGDVVGTVEHPALPDFPRQLDLHAQGLFALGYYQQRQSFFSRRADVADLAVSASTDQISTIPTQEA